MNYDDLLAGGETAIETLLGKQETLSLEFKGLEPKDPIFVDGILSRGGRKGLAKEASAFANSAGGVIVYGIDCRNTDGVDQVEKLTPIDNLARAETSVRDAAADLLQPRHDGIRVGSIPTSAETTRGYVVVDIPRSERRPHRSEAKDQKEYFKRIGSRSYPMEHYDIEDAFRRTSSPALSLEVSYLSAMSIGVTEISYLMNLALRNDGETTAKMVSMQLWDMHGNAYGEDPYGPTIVNRKAQLGGKLHVASPADYAIHPSETRLFHSFRLSVRRAIGRQFYIQQNLLEAGLINFEYSIGAENMRMTRGRYSITEQEVVSFIW